MRKHIQSCTCALALLTCCLLPGVLCGQSTPALSTYADPVAEPALVSLSPGLPDAPQASSSEAQTQTPEDSRTKAARELKEEESQRMLGVVPNFNSVLSGHAEPITARQKFHLFFKSSVDPFQFVSAALDTGLEEIQDSYPEYHHGFPGFARRYGAAFADGFDGNLWGNAILPSLLHQDPRYFRLGPGDAVHHHGVKQRLWYSVISTVRCKGDNGKWQPNYSNVFGNFIGGAISNAYYPASDRGVGLTLERGLTVNAEGALGSLAVEFYPDYIAHRRQRKAQKAAAAAAASSQPTP